MGISDADEVYQVWNFWVGTIIEFLQSLDYVPKLEIYLR